jgi:putative pyruvate formate lyase activating enzyme
VSVSAITPERLRAAALHYRACRLCEHRCAVDRTAGELGKCRADAACRVFRERVEYGDERELVPSHLFYLSGCDLRCGFCINEINAFDPKRGELLTPAYFEERLAAGRGLKPKTLQWVGGEPTIHLPAVLQAMADCRELPKVIWKSDFHGTPEAFDLLDGVVDIYLADFKFGNDACAKRIAGVDNYVGIVTRNLQRVRRSGDLIVRHLLLPGHLDCCFRPVVEYLNRELPGVKFSLRQGYLPHWQAGQYQELGRPLSKREIDAARTIADAAGLNRIP